MNEGSLRLRINHQRHMHYGENVKKIQKENNNQQPARKIQSSDI